MDMTMLMLMMMMGGNRNNNMLPLMMLMSPGTFGNILTPQAMTVAMLPGIGSLGKMMLGGVGAVVAGQMFQKKKTYRKRYYPQRRYYNNYRRRY